MLDVTERLKDLLDSWPVIATFVTTIQSAAVKAISWASPRFNTLKPWAKIASLFVLGFLVYKLVLGLNWVESFVFSLAGTAAAALIYYFGRQPTPVAATPVRPRRTRRTPAFGSGKPGGPDSV